MYTPASGEKTEPSAELLNRDENNCVGTLGKTREPTDKFSMFTSKLCCDQHFRLTSRAS